MNSSFKKLLTFLLVSILIFTLALTIAACEKDDIPPSPTGQEEEEEETETSVILNGSFKTTTGTQYPLTPEKWTGAPGSTSSTVGTPNTADDLLYGVINVKDAEYNKNKNLWGDLANPGKQGEDDNILMIYNKTNTVYKYTNSFTTEAGKYYKVTVPVKTIIQDGDAGKGAYIYFSSGAYAAFEKIDTANVWKTYTLYLEGSLIKSETVSISISLGYGDKDDGKMTKGYAFFDEIKAEEISGQAYSESDLDQFIAKYTMRVPDSRMEYGTGTGTVQSAYGYSGKTGTGAGGSAPNTSNDSTKGIVDTSNWDNKYGVNPGNSIPGIDNKILMIYNKKPTAIGYSGNRKIRFSIAKYYELSLFVCVTVDDEENLEHKGATLILNGPDEFKIENIDTDGVWVKYSFFIKSNEIRDKDFTLEMWLGQGGKEDTDTLTEGFAFFDNISLDEIDEEDYLLKKNEFDANPDACKFYAASLESVNPNLINNHNLDEIAANGLPVGWSSETTSKDVIVNENDVDFVSIPLSALQAEEWTDELKESYLNISENPLAPYPTMAPVFMINNRIPTVSGLGLVNPLKINPNIHYRMAIWLKTFGIEEGLGADIKLVSGEGDDMVELSSFTTINTAKYENPGSNDYLELVFLIQGNEISEKDLRVLIEIGSGTAFDPSKYVQGYVMLANVNMEEITYNEYDTTASSTYIKKYSFAKSESTVTNGNFNKLNLSETELDANGKLIDKPGVPQSWTKSSSTEKNVISGIIDTDNEDLLNALSLTGIYDSPGWNMPFPVDFGAPNILMIQSKPAEGEYNGEIDPFGYSSSNFTLSKNSYYLIRVYAKTTDGAIASIHLTPTTDTNPDNYIGIDTEGEWVEYTFAVATGRDSITTKLNLYLGNKGSENKVSGTVFFDSCSYITIDEDEYTALSNDDTVISISYEVETFDNFKSGSSDFDTPNNWSGTLGNNTLPSGSSNLSYGILSNLTGDVSELGVKDNDGDLIEDTLMDDDLMDLIFDNTITEIGNHVLFVNNKVPTAYNYKMSSSETLTSKSYYEISVYVFTYYIPEGKSARVMLSIGEDTFTFKNVNMTSYENGSVKSTGAWTKYSYYIKTDEETSTSGVNLTLGLGRYLASDSDGEYLVSGYAFFDNAVITTIDEELFNTKKTAFDLAKSDDATEEEKAFTDYNSVIIIDEPESSTPSDPTEEEPKPEDDTTPWLLITYISSAVIGGVIVLVVIIVLVRRIAPKVAARRKLKFKKTSYDRTSATKDKKTTKSGRYDKYKD